MTVVGSAYIEIRALSNKFNKDIQKALNDSLGGVGKDLGKQVGEDFADEYKKTVDAKLKKVVKLPAPDTSEASEKLRELGDEVDKVHSKSRRAAPAVRNLGRSFKELDDHLLSAFGSMVSFGGGFTGLLMTLDAAGGAIGSVLGPLSALVSGLVALTSAIAPAAKASAILPGLFAALGTSAITASLALSGLGKAYTAGAEAAAGGEKEIEKYREALEKLSPEQASFVEELLKNKDAIDEVKNAASEKIFEGLTRALNRVVGNGFLTLVADGLRDAGGALGYVVDQAAKLTGQPFFQRAFSNVMDSNVVIIQRLGRAFVNLAGFFALVASAARPFTEYFASWVETITGNWLEKARGDFHGLRGSIADGVQVAQQLGDIFGNIGEALGDIGRAARPAGRILLNAFEGATEKFAEFTGSTAGQERMREFFLNTTDTVRALGGLVVSVTREFGKLGENPVFAGMINTLAETTVPNLAESLDSLATAIGDDLVGLLDTLAEIGTIMAESGGIEAYLEVMQGFLEVLQGILEIPGLAKLAGYLLAITGAIKALGLITKFVGLQWLITTGLPQLGDKSKTAMAALGPLSAIIFGLYELAAVSNDMSGKDQSPWLTILQSPLDGLREGWESTQRLFSSIKQGFIDFSNWVIPDGSGISNWVAEFLPTDAEVSAALSSFFGGFNPTKMSTEFKAIDWSGMWDFLSTPQTSAGKKAVDGLVKGVEAAWRFITTPQVDWGKIWRFFKTPQLDWRGIGTSITAGIGKGISEGFDGVRDRVRAVATGVINLFKSIFGIRSPSRVFAGFGRNILQGLVNGIKGIPGVVGNIFRSALRTSVAVWNEIASSVAGAAGRARRNAAESFNAMRSNVAGSVQRLGANVRNSLGNLRDSASAIFRKIRSNTTSIAQSIVTGTVGRFNRMRTSVVGAFTSAKNGIAKAWNGIRAAARGPVEYVVNTVFNNGLRRAFNTINNVIPGVPDIPAVSFGRGGATGGSRPASDRGFARGGWTGPGSKYQPAGVVHADEFVIKKESRKRIEQNLPGVLDFMNQKGTLPGYADGGLVDAAKWWQALGARASEHPAFGGVRGGHMKGSLHYSGRAVDLNYGPAGENSIEKSFFDKYVRQFKARFPGLGVLWRVADHFNHMHIDTSGAGSVGSGGSFPSLGSLINPLKALTGKLRGGVGKGQLGDLLFGAGKRMITGSIDMVKDKFSSLAEGAGDFVGNIAGGAKNLAVKGQVRAAAAARGWGSGSQWNALDWLVNKESSWNPNAANPTSSARGLFQKMTSIHGPVESSPLGQARWGLDYIAKRYGDPIKAMRFHQSHGYYADGGRVKIPTFDNGGILGKGLNLVNNATGGPEALVRPERFSPKGLAAEYRALTRVIEQAFGARGRMSSAGSQVVAGLVDGMRSGRGSVSSAAVDTANTAISATQTALDIHSPSRVFRGFGLNIVKGLVVGIASGREGLRKVLTNTIDRLTDYASDRVDTLADNILEGYRRANQRIRAYNKTHKKDKELLQVPTRTQAEETAMRRLGYDKASLAKANALIREMSRTTRARWDEGSAKGTNSLLRAVDTFRKASVLWKKVSLGDLARGAEVLTVRLEKAQEKLQGLLDSHKEMTQSVAGGITGTLDLTSGAAEGGSTNIKSISTHIKGLAAKAKTLAFKLKQLIRSGMPKGFVQEIASLGIDDALSVSQAIIDGTRSQQRALYADFTSVNVNATAVGDVVADQMYQVGINAQKGIVRGLEADKRALTNAARRLAKRLERAVKDELGIKSPSRVFAALGEFLPLGLVLGIEATTSSAVGAVSNLASAMTNAFTPNLVADASVTGTSLAGLSTVGRRGPGSGEVVDSDGLTARDRAIIEAIKERTADGGITVNPPPEMDVFTLAKLIMREIEFRGK